MKKRFIFICLILCAFSLFAEAPKKMYVTSETVDLKAKSSMTSKTIEVLSLGDVVYVSNTKGNWSYVTNEATNSSGWVNSSVLTKKKVVAKGNKVSANASELALAGKGFSAEIESEYKKTSEADFASVDLIEQNLISFEQIGSFMAEGNLEDAQ